MSDRVHPSDEAMFYAIVPAADRRKGRRQRQGALASIARVIDGIQTPPFEVRLTDASARGVGIRSTLPLERGSLYRLQIGFDTAVDVRVVRSRARSDGTFDVGTLYAGRRISLKTTRRIAAVIKAAA